MGCNPSKDGGDASGLVDTAAGGTAAANKVLSKVAAAANDKNANAAETFLIPLCDNDSEEHDSLTGSISEEENSKTMKTSEEVDFEKEFRPDDVELCHAATKIQASFRGHMTRKQQAGGKDEPGGATGSATLSKTEGLESQLKNVDINKDLDAELLDVDLADPELHKAATKIQASFRGHKARKADDAVDNKE